MTHATKNVRTLTRVMACAVVLTLLNVAVADKEHKHDDKGKGPVTITGEVVDLMCYLDHGATGDEHRDCAQRCIKGNGPVGLLVEQQADAHEHAEGGKGAHEDHKDADEHASGKQVYLIIGQHEIINAKLAPHAAKMVTLRGKVVERDGMKMIENAEVVKVGDVVKTPPESKERLKPEDKR